MERVVCLDHIASRDAPVHPRLFSWGRLLALFRLRALRGGRRGVHSQVQGALQTEGRGEDQVHFAAEESLDDQLADAQEEQTL